MRARLILTAALSVVAALALAASAVASPRLYEPSYAGGYPEEVIGGFETGSDGSLTPLSGSPFATVTGSSPVLGITGLAFAPDGTRAVSSYSYKGGAQGLSMSAAGALAPVGSPAATDAAENLAVSPDGRFAYLPTTGGSEGIRVFAIGADGSLASPGTNYGSGKYGDIAITPDGRHLFAGDYSTDKLARFAIAADGSLTPLGSTAVPLNPGALAVSPDGRFLFATFSDYISEVGLASYAIGADGSLEEVGEPVRSTEDSLHYLAVAPDGAHLYVADGNHGVIALAIGADGSLAELGTTPVAEVESVAVSPDGRFLYYQFHDEAHEEAGIGVAELGADGTPTPTSTFAAWLTDEPERLVFAPAPTPTAALDAAPAAPGAATSFDASASVGAVRYDWDFGDGSVLEDGGPTPSHVYASAGTYTATLKVTDANGCSSEQIYTGQSTTCPGGAAATATSAVQIAGPAPRLKSLRVTNRRFAVKGGKKSRGNSARHVKHSTTFRYRLSEPAKVTFAIERKLVGRKVGGKCEHTTRGNSGRKHCVLRFRREGSRFSRAGKRGANSVRFAGKVPRGSGKGKRALKPGAYRVTAFATDAEGGRSSSRRASFWIVAG